MPGTKLDEAMIVITGASSGIGRATARRFAAEGACVVLAARRADPLGELESELGGRALAVPTDVTDEMAVRPLVDRAADRFGGIDVRVNNAAVTSSVALRTPRTMPTAASSRRTCSAISTVPGPRCRTCARGGGCSSTWAR